MPPQLRRSKRREALLKERQHEVVAILKFKRGQKLRVAIHDVALRDGIPLHIHLETVANEGNVTHHGSAIHLEFLLEIGAIDRPAIPSLILKESNHAENPLDSSACVFAHGWKKLGRALELLLLEDPCKTKAHVL
jgi:hypothetical protein